MFKNFNLASIISIIIIGLFVGVIFVYADWSAPNFPPTRCDAGDFGCDAPVNVSSIDQNKVGSLGVLGLNTSGILLNPLSGAPFACNASQKGFLYFDDTQSKHFMCNGSSWTDYAGPQGDTGATGATGPAGDITGNNPSWLKTTSLESTGNLTVGGNTILGDADTDTTVVNGILEIGYQIVSQNSGGNSSATAICPRPKKVIGGGCAGNMSFTLLYSYPSNNRRWQCNYSSNAYNIIAYAICANVGP